MSDHANTAALLALGRSVLLPIYKQREMILERAEGARVWDSEQRAAVAACYRPNAWSRAPSAR